MMKKTVGFSSVLGILAAASGIFAPDASAVAWCPVPGGSTITCNNCNVELSCHVSGLTITINGTGVTFDGQGYSIASSPSQAIKVLRPQARIKNLDIYSPGQSNNQDGHGIHFASTGGSTSYVDNVYINGASHYGIFNSGANPVVVANSTVNNSGSTGIHAQGPSGAYTDVHNTIIDNSGFSGFQTSTAYSFATGNTIYGNVYAGIHAYDKEGIRVERNTLNSNYIGLLVQRTIAPRILNNSGSGNTVKDCYDVSSTNGLHYGNSWGTMFGNNCTP